MQKNTQIVTVTTLICDDHFVKHQLMPTEESTLFWNEWLSNNPNFATEFDQARKLIFSIRLGLNNYAQTYLSKKDEERLLIRIQKTIATCHLEKEIVPIWQRKWIITSAAACVLVLIGLVFWGSFFSPKSLYEQQIASLESILLEKVNTSPQQLLVNLPDGSVALLSPQSRMSYSRDFVHNRKVFLQGEATFEVVKNPENPFYVYANELITKVLGTRFVVNAFDKKMEVVVTVEHGQVSVYRDIKTQKQALEGVLLMPNQQVVFERKTEQFIKTIVEKPILQPSKQNLSFEFDAMPVQEVFDRLEQAYGIELVYNSGTIKKCQLTASINEETLFQKLDIITQSIGATYEMVEGKVIITAQGCK